MSSRCPMSKPLQARLFSAPHMHQLVFVHSVLRTFTQFHVAPNQERFLERVRTERVERVGGPGLLTAIHSLDALRSFASRGEHGLPSVDVGRVLVAGHSMGGHGAWYLGTTEPRVGPECPVSIDTKRQTWDWHRSCNGFGGVNVFGTV